MAPGDRLAQSLEEAFELGHALAELGEAVSELFQVVLHGVDSLVEPVEVLIDSVQALADVVPRGARAGDDERGERDSGADDGPDRRAVTIRWG